MGDVLKWKESALLEGPTAVLVSLSHASVSFCFDHHQGFLSLPLAVCWVVRRWWLSQNGYWRTEENRGDAGKFRSKVGRGRLSSGNTAVAGQP